MCEANGDRDAEEQHMMKQSTMDRREFVKNVGAAAVAVSMASTTFAAGSKSSKGLEGKKGRMKKAVKLKMVEGDMTLRDKFKLLKDLGFDGVEPYAPNDWDQDELLRARDETGLAIPNVVDSLHGTYLLSDPDPAIRKRGVDGLLAALRIAKTYGSTSVLLVVGRVSKEVSYADCYTRSQAEIRKAIPLAEELGIDIAIENVWNNFLLSPLEAARYVDELGSSRIRFFFDVGNIVCYGWPEHWIRILGKRIAKLDIKEYSRTKRDTQGMRKGFEVELLEGDCDWPEVMKALREIGYPEYSGWATAEVPGGGRERLKDLAERMDRIFAS